MQHLMFSAPGGQLKPLQLQWAREYSDEVIAAKPRFFVIADQPIWFSTALEKPTIREGLREKFPDLEKFLEGNYQLKARSGATEIYEFNPSGQAGRGGRAGE